MLQMLDCIFNVLNDLPFSILILSACFHIFEQSLAGAKHSCFTYYQSKLHRAGVLPQTKGGHVMFVHMVKTCLLRMKLPF